MSKKRKAKILALGIDVGATNLRMATRYGHKVRLSLSPGENLLRCGEKRLEVAIRSAWLRLCEELGVGPSRVAPATQSPVFISSVCMGGAGLGRASQRKSAEAVLKKLYPKAKIKATDDATIAMYAAFGKRPGMVILAGTGSLCLAKGSKGNVVRAGGWGSSMDDPGSAYSVGKQALKLCLLHRDGAVRKPAFWDEVLSELGISDPYLLEEVAREVRSVAGLSPVIVRRASRGERQSLGIVRKEARRLCSLAEAAARSLGERPKGVALTGGMFKSPFYVNLFKSLLRNMEPFQGVRIFRLRKEPAIGALRLAEEALSIGRN